MNTAREFEPHDIPDIRPARGTVPPGVLEEATWVYYDVGRLTHNYTTQAGVFRRLLEPFPFEPAERPHYHLWLEQDAYTSLQQARDQQALTAGQLEVLRSAGDPAVLIMDSLRSHRLEQSPGRAHDVRILEIAERGFELILTSIHGNDPTYLHRLKNHPPDQHSL